MGGGIGGVGGGIGRGGLGITGGGLGGVGGGLGGVGGALGGVGGGLVGGTSGLGGLSLAGAQKGTLFPKCQNSHAKFLLQALLQRLIFIFLALLLP